ncbi:MAG: hypothetical protein LBJ15_16425 [Comamonas sp.]|uniref:hypothetical protein n=1 Tax=Comamonas sp. TaxID=34028 RepID=UPI002819CCC8|nr:hypothetical protein [Comamonas sp.]MDR0215569.1 hypothetical protein [Comamonas sp.]
MKGAANLAAQGLRDVVHHQEQAAKPVRKASPRTRKLFVVLHGAYGSSFLSKFNTGQLADGQDKGVRMAMLVWDSALAKFSDDVVELAVERIKRASPEFAPTLPMLEKECEAATPVQAYAQQQGWVALPAPPPAPHPAFQRMGDGRDWARGLRARHEAGQKLTPTVVAMFRKALGQEARTA